MAETKKRLTVTLSEEIFKRLQNQAPQGNVSAFVDHILREYFGGYSHLDEPQSNSSIEAAIEHYRREMFNLESCQYDKAYRIGKELVLSRELSFELLRSLALAREEFERESRTKNIQSKWYNRVESDDLIELKNDYAWEDLDGLFDGIMAQWEVIMRNL